MRIKVLSLLLALFAALLPASVLAQNIKQAVLIEVPEGQKLIVPVAQLMRVDEGVFELEVGKTIDLTDRKILLSMQYDGRKRCCRMTLNGRRENYVVGTRIDLKKGRSTASFVQDKDVCFLDVVDIAVPKGAPGIATFRLHCL